MRYASPQGTKIALTEPKARILQINTLTICRLVSGDGGPWDKTSILRSETKNSAGRSIKTYLSGRRVK